ncbi:hypothetical protein TNCV_4592731 [Trichonephila clavipes]|nr:hypothetical protein TNCV_4592731 [Trichonephila clavipes]
MNYRRKKWRFYWSQHSEDRTLEPVAADVTSASTMKLCLDSCSYQSHSNEKVLEGSLLDAVAADSDKETDG